MVMIMIMGIVITSEDHPHCNSAVSGKQAIAAVAEGASGSEALALRLALRVTMLAAQQNRETL